MSALAESVAPQVPYAPQAARIENDQQALEVAHTVARALAEGASQRDRERRLPYAEIGIYSASGLWGIAVPREFGGAEVSYATLAEVTAIISEADPAIGQIPQNHFYMLDVLRVNGTRQQQAFYFQRALAGERFGNALSERGTKTVADYRTTLTPDGDGFRISGTKFYSTGALFAQWIPIVAKAADNTLYVAFASAQTPGLSVVDDWSGFGQRTTGSGTTTLDNVYVEASAVVPYSAAFDARRFVRERSRPWIDSGVERASDDPLTLELFGKLALQLHAAEALVERAGRRVDAAVKESTAQTVATASIAVAEARAATTEIALQASTRLIELAGTQATLAEHTLDRHWRNARTHTLHDPVRWKYIAVGNYYLNDVLPPRHGAI